ncbi:MULTISPECIES: hypothetical protein [unclassified Geodermatophilus]
MPAHVSDPDDLALHGPRVLGFASPGRIAARYGLDRDEVEDRLIEHATRGWVTHTRFADSAGWSLTEAGRAEDERRMGAELELTGARDVVAEAHGRFVPLNRRFGKVCTDWQLRPTRTEPMAANDHTDWRWDERVLRALGTLGRDLAAVTDPLARCLQRLDGYSDRYAAALARVDHGERRWVDSPEVDSCHTVWIQLHEDLLATLGIERGQDA